MITQLHDVRVHAEAVKTPLAASDQQSKSDGPLPLEAENEATDSPTANENAPGANSAPRREPSLQLPEKLESGVKDLVDVLKLLSDETRLRILLYLTRAGELHVRALCDRLQQSQPAVSHHLALLRVAGLIAPRREGKHNYYRLLPGRFVTLLDTLFDGLPDEQQQLRFEGYVLGHAPRSDGQT